MLISASLHPLLAITDTLEGLSPIFKYFSNLTENVKFAASQLLDILENVRFFFSGETFPIFLALSGSVFVSIFVVRFLLLK